jgi:hypothetical protein
MRVGIQSFLLSAGESSCYALDIIRIGEMELGGDIPVIEALTDGIKKGCIYYNWENSEDNDNFYVGDPGRFLSLLAGGKWVVTKEGPDYQPRPGEHVVQRWERQKTGTTIGHFRLPNWDSLADSKTVKFGRLISTRVFRKIA